MELNIHRSYLHDGGWQCQGMLQALQELAAFKLIPTDNNQIQHVRVARKKNGGFIVSRRAENHSSNKLKKITLFAKDIFGRSSADDLRFTKDIFKQVQQHIQAANCAQEKSALKNMYKIPVQEAFQGLRSLYEHKRSLDSSNALIHKNDILEAMATAFEADKGLNKLLDLDIQRIAQGTLTPPRKRLQSYSIPLVKSENISAVTRMIEEKFPAQLPTLEDIQCIPELNKFVIQEDASLGFLLERMYKHKRAGKLLNNRLINWGTTQLLALKTKRKMQKGAARTKAVVDFFKRMHISLSVCHKGELYAYGEFFKRDIRHEKSLDAAFQRSLTDTAARTLLEDARKERMLIQSEVGANFSPIVCNSFCRLRVKEVPKGNISTGFSITGKILNRSEKNRISAKKEKSYAAKYDFSLKNMFGNENDIDLKFNQYSLLSESKLNALQAEHLYRCCLTNAVDREDALMVVQRLAPADIHHYIEPVGGKVLSLKEASKKLLAIIDETAQPHEAKQLAEIIKTFDAKETSDTAYRAKATTDLQGSRLSVSTLATRHQSPLSQNDRRIMMVEHADGSIAIHTFIGAVGVNNVKINAVSGPYAAGADIGSMGFGDERHRRARSRTANKKNSILLKAKANAKFLQGSKLGGFTKEGSTVVSIYFKKDFVPTDVVSLATDRLAYRDGRGLTREIEIQAQMGQVIGLPAPFVAMKVVQESLVRQGIDQKEEINKLLEEKKTIDEIVNHLLDLYIKAPAQAPRMCASIQVDKKIRSALSSLKQDLSKAEQKLLDDLRKNLAHKVANLG